jgi:hypothetical protein
MKVSGAMITEQKRDIIRLTIATCVGEKKPNPYYCKIIKMLVEDDKSHAFTVQTTMYDQFKILGSGSSKIAVKKARNLGVLVGDMMISGILSASVLKKFPWDDIGECEGVALTFLLDRVFCESNSIMASSLWAAGVGADWGQDLASWGFRLCKEHRRNVKGSLWRSNWKTFCKIFRSNKD